MFLFDSFPFPLIFQNYLSQLNVLYFWIFSKILKLLQFAMLQIAEFLIEKGVDIHAKDMYHRTALHPACNRGHYDIVQMLIQHEAQVLIHSIIHSYIS